MKKEKLTKKKLLDEEKCVVCRRKTKDPFAKLVMGFDTSEARVTLRYCSWNCLECDHINQVVDIIMNHSDNEFLNDLSALIEARKEVLEKEEQLIRANKF